MNAIPVQTMGDDALSLALQQPQSDEEPLFEALPPSPDTDQDLLFPSQLSGSYSSWHHVDQQVPHNASFPVGAGLRNMGNTCFLNAVLQCFTHTPPLVNYLKNCEHKTPCVSEGFCALCALREHFNKALSSSGAVIEPTKLVNNLSSISASFQRWQQEDAHEYMHCLLEALHKSNLSPMTSNACLLQGDSLVKKLFGGCLRSQLKCVKCSHCSDTFEPLIDLSLEVDQSNSITEALESFTSVETVDCNGKYGCENCKHCGPVLKQLTIDRAPEVLLIQLKRFTNNGILGDKICKDVAYPAILDLKSFVSNGQETEAELKYELYAVLVHSGWSMDSGHYYSFVRTSPDVWHKLDDWQVRTVDKRTVLDQQAYILFYFRQGSSWFLSPTEETLNHSMESPKSVLDDSNSSNASDSLTDKDSESSISTRKNESQTERDANVDVCSIESITNVKQDQLCEVKEPTILALNAQSHISPSSSGEKRFSPTVDTQSTPVSSSLSAEKRRIATENIQSTPLPSSLSVEKNATAKSVEKSSIAKSVMSSSSSDEKRAPAKSIERMAFTKPVSDVCKTPGDEEMLKSSKKNSVGNLGNSHPMVQQATPHSITKVLNNMPGSRRACFLQLVQPSNNAFQTPKRESTPSHGSRKRNSPSKGSSVSKRRKQANGIEGSTTGRRGVKTLSPKGKAKRVHGSSTSVSPCTKGKRTNSSVLEDDDDPYSFELEIEQMPQYAFNTDEGRSNDKLDLTSLHSSELSKKTLSPNKNLQRSKRTKEDVGAEGNASKRRISGVESGNGLCCSPKPGFQSFQSFAVPSV